MSDPDSQLSEVIAATAVKSIPDVLTVMQGIDAALPDDDGLKWFNYLYMKVTESIDTKPPAEGWEDPAWLARLDVVFAGLYFTAVAAWERDPDSAPGAWIPLFEARNKPGIQRLQFALAGMNAHINRDLQVALVQTGKELEIPPQSGTPEYRDYERVNTILEQVEGQVKQEFATGAVGKISDDLGAIGDVIAMWNIRTARETAWGGSQLLWTFSSSPFPGTADVYVKHLDRTFGLVGRALLLPVGRRIALAVPE